MSEHPFVIEGDAGRLQKSQELADGLGSFQLGMLSYERPEILGQVGGIILRFPSVKQLMGNACPQLPGIRIHERAAAEVGDPLFFELTVRGHTSAERKLQGSRCQCKHCGLGAWSFSVCSGQFAVGSSSSMPYAHISILIPISTYSSHLRFFTSIDSFPPNPISMILYKVVSPGSIVSFSTRER